ncbi:hypothetical protein C8Q80DRAFT_347516 [Daedaleopsis nitida]|nr:hypothetical protein C8Q80DRAFT_347516 [Daedaleopsis nitida]
MIPTTSFPLTSSNNSTSVHTPSTPTSLSPSTRPSPATTPTQSPSSPPAGRSQHKNPLPVRIVIGVVAGGAALAIGIIVVALYLHRRRRFPFHSRNARVEPWRLYEKGLPVPPTGRGTERTQSRHEPTPFTSFPERAGLATSQALPHVTSATVVSNLRTEITALREVMERLQGIVGAETRSLPRSTRSLHTSSALSDLDGSPPPSYVLVRYLSVSPFHIVNLPWPFFP